MSKRDAIDAAGAFIACLVFWAVALVAVCNIP